jgi:hypothetical protein
MAPPIIFPRNPPAPAAQRERARGKELLLILLLLLLLLLLLPLQLQLQLHTISQTSLLGRRPAVRRKPLNIFKLYWKLS